MSRVQVWAWKCDSCGHEWLSKQKPVRCANPKCQVRTWDKNGTAEPVEIKDATTSLTEAFFFKDAVDVIKESTKDAKTAVKDVLEVMKQSTIPEPKPVSAPVQVKKEEPKKVMPSLVHPEKEKYVQKKKKYTAPNLSLEAMLARCKNEDG